MAELYSVFQSNPSVNVASPQSVSDNQNHFDRVTFIRDLSQSLVEQQEEERERVKPGGHTVKPGGHRE